MQYIHDPATLKRAREGDEKALEQVILSNMGLVKSIALRFVSRGVETEDLIQIGTVGMVKAVRGFDETRECKFTTYAVPLICGEIKRFLRDDGWIKISRDTKANGVKIFRFQEDFEKREGRSPTLKEICEALGLDEEKAVFALDAARPALSLYQEDEETGFSLEKQVGEDRSDEICTRLALQEAVKRLPPQERSIIEMRYFKNLTQSKVAQILGLTQVKISREEKRILKKMREEFFSAS